MHTQGYDEKGHICFSTISMKRAIDYLTLKGVKFNQILVFLLLEVDTICCKAYT